MRRFILGLDEGTTNIRSVLYDIDKQDIVDSEAHTFKQFYPHNGWVEQDALEIFNKILKASKDVLKRNAIGKDELLGIGITNQRETVVAWNRKTGEPIYHAICWQCRRSASFIESLSPKAKELIREKTGLIPNAYFSASKIKWVLDNIPDAKKLLKTNDLCFGTIDCFLAFKLTGNFVTDTTNASRTMLFNIHTLKWDEELLKIFGVQESCLPKVLSCDAKFGTCSNLLYAPLCGIIGDQMSSMVGQGAISCGNTKVTYGTGGFVLSNLGTKNNKNFDGLLTTIASTLDGKTEYAVEGSIYSACSAIDWIKKAFDAYDDVKDTEKLATSIPDNDGVYLVPAFTGLGAPYWKDDARACLVGMTFGTAKAHIVRATLESMVYNTKAIFDLLKSSGHKFGLVSVDGGGSKNGFVLQFLADMLNHEITKSKHSESTALGCIYVAMLSLGIIKKNDIKKMSESKKKYLPSMNEKTRKKFYSGWEKAIKNI